MLKRARSVAIALFFTSITALCSGPAIDLHRGLELINPGGDCASAVRVFETLFGAPDRSVAARALLYAAYCEEKLGRPTAWDHYARAALQFTDQPDVTALARNRLSAGGRRPERILPLVKPRGIQLRLVRTIKVPGTNNARGLAVVGEQLYLGSREAQAVLLVDIQTGKLVYSFPMAGPVDAVVGASDGSVVYAGDSAGNVAMIETRTKRVRRARISGSLRYLAPTADGRWLYFSTWSELRRMDTSTLETSVVHPGCCSGALVLTPDGKTLVVVYQGGGPGGSPGHDAIAWFDAPTGKLLGTLTTLAHVGGDVTASPDGRLIWASGGDACSSPRYDHIGCPMVPAGLIHIIDAAERKLLHTIASPQPRGFKATSISPDGTLAVVAEGGRLPLFDTQSFELAAEFRALSSAAVFSRDSRRIYAVVKRGIMILQLIRS